MSPHTSLQTCCILSQGSKHWRKYPFIRNSRAKIAERASAPLILNALHFHVTGLRKVHFLKIAWFTWVMLKCHTEIMVGTAKYKKQAATAVTPHFQFLFYCVCWSYPQCQLGSKGYIMELMSKYYYEGFFFFPLWQVLIFNCLDISGCHTDGCSHA